MAKIKTNIPRQSLGQRMKNDFRKNHSLYLMFLPILAFYLIFHYGPMYGATIAFENFKPQKGILGSDFVGFKHFIDFFTSPSFGEILGNTFRISFSTLLFSFPAPIILALMLNELRSVKYAKLVQNITYMPHFVSMVVVCGIIRTFTLDTGVIPYLMSLFGFEAKTLLNYPQYFTTIYVASEIWQGVGWGSIIYLAALTGIDPQLYEAAMIDGAGKWKQTLHVTLPGIIPTIVIMLIMRMGRMLNVGYEKIILLYNASTMSVADVISTYTYRKGLIDLNWSFSSAVGLFNSVVNLVFLTATNAIAKKFNDTSLW